MNVKYSVVIAFLSGPLAAWLAFWIVATLLYALPPPETNCRPLYRFAYRVLQFIAANYWKMRQTRADTPSPIYPEGNPLSIAPRDPSATDSK